MSFDHLSNVSPIQLVEIFDEDAAVWIAHLHRRDRYGLTFDEFELPAHRVGNIDVAKVSLFTKRHVASPSKGIAHCATAILGNMDKVVGNFRTASSNPVGNRRCQCEPLPEFATLNHGIGNADRECASGARYGNDSS
jgi:hypothetical protein